MLAAAQLTLLQGVAAVAAPAAFDPAPPAMDAVERQREQVREAVRPCPPGEGEDDIVVCGQLPEESGAPGGGYVPPRGIRAPGEGPWFEVRRGPLSIACCSVDGALSTGAGLSLRIRF
jgi:hypothetical protein